MEGLPSEMLGPVPRDGGPETERVEGVISGWRAAVEQRADIAAARVLEGGDDAALARALASIERALADHEHYARADVAATGHVEPARLSRIEGLRARRGYLRTLQRVTGHLPPAP